jgi:hypothetical protein
MAFPIRYKVPYQIDVHAIDLGSGKLITNTFYAVSNFQTVAPPAYGAPIAGPSSTATLLAQFRGLWGGFIARANHNYQTREYDMRAMLGKRFSSPFFAIAAYVGGTPVVLTTSSPHGLLTGDVVAVSGVTSPATLNAQWTITVVNPTTFQLDGSSIVGAWSGDGFVQKVVGVLEVQYADKETLLFADTGGVAGDALPLFCASSIRRVTAGVGRSYRSRFSLSPMSEVDSVDGAFTTTQKGLMVTALAAFNVSMTNGGSDATSGSSFQVSFSRKIAFGLASPWTTNIMCAPVISMAQQPNTGSIVRRKPKLTSVIV